ncbi:MAG: hypothetical protein A3C07_02600 [Candidatus Sungbacteria bacterium RIFCSPHIGHO2_02_FULL_47_11]|uniref:Uncharacterized protein n=1 Tax=Candidatus Sungbacteria bacterium RIFCSPHIGHO2_02_FULL_47_11 TaxID=1802270 RepID=A0A1G2KG85_9BACT|nr:MAG: hypothetical protein A3C07_02600 [Candidatus Sungbacteria bacterium RIFCSPHIGHO2_02_FULL_47_11]
MKKIILSLSVLAAVAAVAVGATTAFFSDTETSTGNTFTAGAIDLTVDNTSYFSNSGGEDGIYNSATSWLLKDLDSEDLFFNFSDLKPGDWGEDTISLHVDNNDSWLCADVTLDSDDDVTSTEPELEGGDEDVNDDPTGELANRVRFIWWADDGDNVLETCDFDNAPVNCADESTLNGGPLGALGVGNTAKVTLADSGNSIWEGGPVPGESTRYIGKAWCFGDINEDPVDQDGVGFTQAVGGNGPDERGAGFSCDGSDEDNSTQTDSMTATISFRAEQSRNNPGFTCLAD